MGNDTVSLTNALKDLSHNVKQFTRVLDNSNKIEIERLIREDKNAPLTYPDLSNTDYPVLGPECFTNKDYTVISYKGENYYQACGELVREVTEAIGSSSSHCVKRINHPGNEHEDFDGNTNVVI